ncbi:peptidase M23 [Paenibacillus antri]|uniref:Peptidase M23 n=1 Tax=Paenibacillus antri TaxID=2582848 RepID=A0A5R9GAX1_9BACL|nr:M23 family metallopeptidase [Paenibacillus antri]TLS48555.1 peptidase M23 [Paenibacillus antri]
MIPHRWTKKLTFLIIPEANRQVRRLQFSAVWLYILPPAALLLSASAAVLVQTQSAALQANGDMKAEWSAERAALGRTLEAKNTEIAKLQDEVVRLSQEAETFSAKMAELQSLEREILSLTEADAGTPAAQANRANETAAGLSVPAGSAVGGQYDPVDTEEALRLSQTTHGEFEAMSVEAERLEGALQEALQEAEKLALLRRGTPSIFPTTSTTVTSSFGYRKDPFTRRSAYHKGIDFGGDVGDPIFATADGQVTRTGYDRAMGNYIYVKHGNGFETVYMHLSKSLVAKGQRVKKGDRIGKLGSTGRSTGPHLHYEVHKNGEPINPKRYFSSKEG